ncbi:MAG: hypothetical protein P8Y30_05160 [candidate division WOR-3 bacterium]
MDIFYALFYFATQPIQNFLLAGYLPDLYVPPERLRAQALSGEPWAVTGDVDPDKKTELGDRFSGLALSVGASILDEIFNLLFYNIT